MGSYIPNTRAEQEQMLKEAGYSGFDELFSSVPDEVRLKKELDLPSGMSELEVARRMDEIASKNVLYKHIFRGAGAYDHYIPAIVKSVTSKEEFVTSYTPYQAEISQGVLQAIFEYQTMMCELTGLDIANASHYDAGTAAAESIAMCKDRKRSRAYVSETVHPGIIQVMKTYCFGSDTELIVVPEKDGITDIDTLKEMLEGDAEAACFFMQQPNFYGQIEDATLLGEITHAAGAKFVMGVNPISLAVLKTPAECGADIAVGDGQPLGMPLGYGGPYLGFMATTQKMMRKLPGRIIGETTDHDGNRAFVLTLQAREQHIRREKASSNICSNQALCALTASVYLVALGTDGLKAVATQSMSKAHYLKDKLTEAGLEPVHGGEFFHEFVTFAPGLSSAISVALSEEGILGGLPLTDDLILWCCTEKNTKADMDKVASIVSDIVKLNGKEAK